MTYVFRNTDTLVLAAGVSKIQQIWGESQIILFCIISKPLRKMIALNYTSGRTLRPTETPSAPVGRKAINKEERKNTMLIHLLICSVISESPGWNTSHVHSEYLCWLPHINSEYLYWLLHIYPECLCWILGNTIFLQELSRTGHPGYLKLYRK